MHMFFLHNLLVLNPTAAMLFKGVLIDENSRVLKYSVFIMQVISEIFHR